MAVTHEALNRLDKHWAVVAFGQGRRDEVFSLVNIRHVKDALGKQLAIGESDQENNFEVLDRLATAYEIAAIEGINALLYQASEDSSDRLREQAQAGAYRAFEIRRVMPLPLYEEARYFHVLHLAALAYCGERWADIRRWLREHSTELSISSPIEDSWDKRVLAYLYDCWIRLLRKDGWNDLNNISEIVTKLREEQAYYEPQILNKDFGPSLRFVAYRLIALYHWAKATELLAVYMLQGEPAAIVTELDQHFEAGREAAMLSQDPALEVILRWLHVASRRMVLGSIWRTAQAINSRLTNFIKNVTKNRALFELLPPQREALQEEGLLDPANRAVVVDMPTSGGKTILAEFRILQALNQFDADKGWVAYVAPTRALVAQITRRLREDFGPIGIQVEHLTSAVEIDSFEDAILEAKDGVLPFHILVATPEKLQLVIRNKKISRPLSLIIMDEAHNIEDEDRGLRIELLLATIKRDCSYAYFLLMMPYVPNASDLVRWLAPEAGKTISLGTSAWQPNECMVGMFSCKQENGVRGNWSLDFETLVTTRNTIYLQGHHQVGTDKPLDIPYSRVAHSLTNQAGAMAKVFSEKGTSIAIARTIRDTWSLARTIARNLESFSNIPPEISLVQRFLATEISPNFELITLLNVGVAVHHSGLSEETRSLVEWLAEIGKLRVLCATTTLAQGINFPVSSVFLASRYLPTRDSRSKEMSKRSFWNLAGRAGRLDQGSVGIIGLSAGEHPEEIRKYVKDAVGILISRLVKLLDALEANGELNNLSLIIQKEQWTDFRSYIAHLWNEKRNLEAVLAETEQILRNTFGYGVLQATADEKGRIKARALLDATKSYAQQLSDHPENAMLADTTGFSPEGVRVALLGLDRLEQKLTVSDWQPSSLFGDHSKSTLPQLIGVMMKIPQLKEYFDDISLFGTGQMNKNIAEVAHDWVTGRTIEEIAIKYFSGTLDDPVSLTEAISDACKGIYRALSNAGTWGLSALSKMPTSGINFESLSNDTQNMINILPALLYHGVGTEAAVLMRMNSVPRSIAEPLGKAYSDRSSLSVDGQSVRKARNFLQSLKESDWERMTPPNAIMSGSDYRSIWSRLSGEKI